MPVTISIEIPPRTAELIGRLERFPQRAPVAIARGMDKAAALTVSDIQERRLTGKGPFPVEEGRLGVVTNRLRSSLRASPAVVEGESASVSIGTNVEYAAIHEFGGVIHRTVKPGKVRLRIDKNGQLIRGERRGAIFAKKKQKAKEVGYEGGKSYTITIPARAPIGHGIADNAVTFEREITRSVTEELRGVG